MSEFLIQIITSSAISSLLTAAIVWLTKSWISERLKNSIKNEYDEKLETHRAQLKANSDVEIERLKSQLSIASLEHQIRFAKFHEKRAEVIAELYSLLVHAYWETESFASPMEWAGEPNKQEKYVTAINSIAAFYRFFDKNRLYLPEEFCEQIKKLVMEMRGKAISFGVYVRHDEQDLPAHQLDNMHKAWEAAWKYFEEEVPAIRATLENELRRLIGG